MYNFAGAYRSETIFATERFYVHAAVILCTTQIGTIPLRFKKKSEPISEHISQSVNNMKRNKEAGKVNFLVKVLFVHLSD